MSEEEIAGAEHTPTGRLSVVATTTDGIRVLTLAGEIDHHTGDTLRQALAPSGTARPRIVIDMHLVTFMDSSGINILIAAHQTLSQADGWLRLAAVGTTVKRTLSIVGVDALIDCHHTLHQALTG
ncbi:STAS domain-containing protein [Streptomyces sp. NPDC001286]